MRSILFLALLPAAMVAAPPAGPLAVVKPAIAQSDGGDPLPADFKHVAGETLFFSCNIAGFTKSPEEQINLTYSVQAFDPKGVPVAEIYNGEAKEEVGPQDKDWLPRIETQIVLPDLLRPGQYKILVKVNDLLAKTNAELTLPLTITGLNVPSSPTLTVQDFRWYHNEDDARALAQPVYHPGQPMFMKFAVTGFKYGANNKVDVSYVTSLVLESGKTIWTQPEAAVEQSDGFYPKPYITGEFGITLQPNFEAGTYTMAVAVKDAVGKQNYTGTFKFTVVK